jgi:hypothetical protein
MNLTFLRGKKESDVSKFLRELADKMDDETLSEDEKRLISEFYMEYKGNQTEISESKEFMKFFTLGWYIYNNLVIDNDTIEHIED